MLNHLLLNYTNMKEMEKYISETLPYLLFKISKHIDVGASKFLGVQRNFAQNFPNLPKKLLCNIYRPFLWCSLHKNGLNLFFCKPWAPFLKVKQRWVSFLPDFQGFCLDV